MRRIIFIVGALALSAENRAPVDTDRLNRFAQEYNRYAEELHGGIVDVKQWARVAKAWRELTGE